MSAPRTFAALAVPVLLVVSTPWPLGSRLPWAAMTAATIAIAGGAIWLASVLASGERPPARGALVPAGLFLALTGAQWLLGLSAYAHATATAWLGRLGYLLVLWMVIDAARTETLRSRLAIIVAWTGIGVCLLALAQHVAGNGLLFGFYEPPYAGARFGPFNNRNYFAGYAIVALAPALALVLSDGVRRRPVLAALTATAALAVPVSMSRGGTLALGVAALIVFAGSTRYRTPRRRLLVATATLAVLLLGLLVIQQTDRVFGRLETVLEPGTETSFTKRAWIWGDTLTMIADRPVIGSGLGTYGSVFQQYRTQPNSHATMHAHSEYLEILAETGVIGGALCLWFLASLLGDGRRRLTSSSGCPEPARLGALAGWAGILVYAAVDFPTIIPAIDYTLALLGGLALAPVAGE